ncbi:MAG TPA: hypothetical protein VM677_27085 [Actinokineospora sp.]|nr:hypothetical protein [Actinokineospora sp.]
MTTASSAEAVDYTVERHAALDLVNTGQIVATDAILRRADEADLDFGVFAALLWLGGSGYLERRLPSPDDDPAATLIWPVRLTVAGMQLLTWFLQTHGRWQRLSR